MIDVESPATWPLSTAVARSRPFPSCRSRTRQYSMRHGHLSEPYVGRAQPWKRCASNTMPQHDLFRRAARKVLHLGGHDPCDLVSSVCHRAAAPQPSSASPATRLSWHVIWRKANLSWRRSVGDADGGRALTSILCFHSMSTTRVERQKRREHLEKLCSDHLRPSSITS